MNFNCGAAFSCPCFIYDFWFGVILLACCFVFVPCCFWVLVLLHYTIFIPLLGFFFWRESGGFTSVRGGGDVRIERIYFEAIHKSGRRSKVTNS